MKKQSLFLDLSVQIKDCWFINSLQLASNLTTFSFLWNLSYSFLICYEIFMSNLFRAQISKMNRRNNAANSRIGAVAQQIFGSLH